MSRPVVFLLGIALLVGGAGCGGGGSGGGGDGGPFTVALLYAGGAGFAADVEAKLEALGLDVTIFAFDSGVPTAAQLTPFDAVLVSADGSVGFDNAGLGDVLADVSDAGVGVVLAMFLYENAPGNLTLDGRWDAEDYHVVPETGTVSGTLEGLGLHDAGHPIMTGVASFSGGTASYRPDTFSLHPDADLVAAWTDGRTLVATRVLPTGRRRVDLGFFPVSSDVVSSFWDATTDGDRLVANALLWASGDI